MVDSGANLTCLKRHGGWISSTVAEGGGYIEESISNKINIVNKIFNVQKTETVHANVNANSSITYTNNNATSVVSVTVNTRHTLHYR